MEKSNVAEYLTFGDIIYLNHHRSHFFSFYISIELYTGSIQTVFHKVLQKFLGDGL